MKTRLLVCAAALAVLTLGASGALAEGEIQALADKWTAAYNKHDKEALGNLYTEDAALMMHGSATINGRAAISDFWESDFDIGSPITQLQVTHSVVGIDMMLVHGNYQVIDRDDGTQMGGGRFAHIWILGDDGEWRLDRDLWNEPFEPFE